MYVCDISHCDTFMYQIWYVIAQKNLWPVDFEVKGQHRIRIMNVRDTSSHSYTLMCQKWLANAKANKRPMGHIAHLKNQFKSTNTFEQCQLWQVSSGEKFLNFVNDICKFVIISNRKRALSFNLNKLKSPSAKDAFCQVWLKLAKWFQRRRYLIFVMYFRYIIQHIDFTCIKGL